VYEKETKYLYNPSNSSIASPVVVAKKKTHPFIRLCGDYKKVNKYLRVPKYPIPDVIPELHKLVENPIYIDCDVIITMDFVERITLKCATDAGSPLSHTDLVTQVCYWSFY
jgi:lipopolysaccharide biosynthesis glycosyltransferase